MPSFLNLSDVVIAQSYNQFLVFSVIGNSKFDGCVIDDDFLIRRTINREIIGLPVNN